MSGIAAFVALVLFFVIFAVVGVRIWRIARMLLKPGSFQAAYAANLNRELRKAGIDPAELDMDSLRARKRKPTSVSPELQGAVIKAFARTLRTRVTAIDSDTRVAAQLAQTPQLAAAPAPAQGLAPHLGSCPEAHPESYAGSYPASDAEPGPNSYAEPYPSSYTEPGPSSYAEPGPSSYAAPYRPPAIDAPSKGRRSGVIAVVLLLLAAGFALVLRHGA